jgi:hypothetical protein
MPLNQGAIMPQLGLGYKNKEDLIYVPISLFYKDLYKTNVYKIDLKNHEFILLKEEIIPAEHFLSYSKTLLNFYIGSVREKKILSMSDTVK